MVLAYLITANSPTSSYTSYGALAIPTLLLVIVFIALAQKRVDELENKPEGELVIVPIRLRVWYQLKTFQKKLSTRKESLNSDE